MVPRSVGLVYVRVFCRHRTDGRTRPQPVKERTSPRPFRKWAFSPADLTRPLETEVGTGGGPPFRRGADGTALTTDEARGRTAFTVRLGPARRLPALGAVGRPEKAGLSF